MISIEGRIGYLLIPPGTFSRGQAIIGLDRIRSIILWGGGIGLILVASALIDRAVGHRPLFAPRLSWPFVGGVMIAPIVEEIAFRGVVLPGLRRRYPFVTANTLTAVFFLGIHLPGGYFQGRLWAMLAHLVGEPCRYSLSDGRWVSLRTKADPSPGAP